jgi:hypothetical protein
MYRPIRKPRNEATLAAAQRKGYAALRAEHIADHQRLFRRVAIDLGTTAAAENCRPTSGSHSSPRAAIPRWSRWCFNTVATC